jgi:predicted CoA-binding protein
VPDAPEKSNYSLFGTTGVSRSSQGAIMTKNEMITEFLSHKKLALMRYSQQTPVQGVSMDKELAAKGYSVSVVYLNESDPKLKLSGLKTPVEGLIIAMNSQHTEQAVSQAIDAKIARIWLQTGAQSEAAIAACKKSNIPVIDNECVLMFAGPVKSIHAFHRWIWKLLGKLPK